MVFNRRAILFTLLLLSLTLTSCSTVQPPKKSIYEPQQQDVKYDYFKNSPIKHSYNNNNFPITHNAKGLDVYRENRGKPESDYPNLDPKGAPNLSH